jgi:hypothetical protein
MEQIIEIKPNRRLELELPYELPVGRAKIALTIIPENLLSSTSGKTAFGCLHHYANPAMIFEEKGVWERATIKKYAKN